MKNSDFSESLFEECEVERSTFSFSNLTRVKFVKGYLYKSEIQSCQIQNSILLDIVINDTNFIRSDLTDSIVRGKIMEMSHFGRSILVRADFSNSSFEGRLWSEPNFLEANARNAKFIECNFNFVDMSHANLEDANFTDSYLKLVEISTGNMKNTNFTRSTIVDFNICDTILDRTNFTDVAFAGFFIASEAQFNDTVFLRAKNNISEIELRDTIYEESNLPF